MPTYSLSNENNHEESQIAMNSRTIELLLRDHFLKLRVNPMLVSSDIQSLTLLNDLQITGVLGCEFTLILRCTFSCEEESQNAKQRSLSSANRFSA